MKVGIELRKKAKDKTNGILFLRVVNNGKRKYRSLKIELPFNSWNIKKQRVKSNYPYSKKINLELDNEVLKIKNSGVGITKKQSLVNIFDKIIKDKKPSTQLSYQKDFKTFKRFLESRNLTNIYLDEVNNQLFKDYKDFLLTPENHKRPIGENTANTKFQVLKSILNTCIEEDLIFFNSDPFRQIKFNKNTKKKEYLPIDQLHKLINSDLDVYDNIARQIFIFQVFSQGMRISDTLLLNYGNIDFNNDIPTLNYVQSKSGSRINLNLNGVQLRIINKILNEYDTDVEVIKCKKEIEKIKRELDLYEYHNSINSLNDNKFNNINSGLPLELQKNRYNSLSDDDLLKEKNDLKKQIQKLNAKILKYKISKRSPNEKIFYFNKSLNNTSTGKTLRAKEYESLRIIVGTINKRLNRISKKLNIKHLSSHIARHTFAMLNLNEGILIEDLSNALGHKSLSVTYNYISQLPTNRLNKKMSDFADKF